MLGQVKSPVDPLGYIICRRSYLICNTDRYVCAYIYMYVCELSRNVALEVSICGKSFGIFRSQQICALQKRLSRCTIDLAILGSLEKQIQINQYYCLQFTPTTFAILETSITVVQSSTWNYLVVIDLFIRLYSFNNRPKRAGTAQELQPSYMVCLHLIDISHHQRRVHSIAR